MGYRAQKKKITECQKIIQDYEAVRKKVMETRNISRTIKREVIDVDTFERSMPDTQSSNLPERKFPRPTAVTDSDIDDILAIVHDKTSTSRSLSKTGTQKRAANTPLKNLKSLKIERQSSPENRSPSLEPISSTSKDLDKPARNNTFLASTSIENNSLSFVTISKANKAPLKDRSPPADINGEAVTSSVQTPTETDKKHQPEKNSSRKRQSSTSKSPSNRAKAMNSAEEICRKPRQKMYKCTTCKLKLKSTDELESHKLNEHVNNTSKKEEELKTPSPRSRKVKQEDSITSSDGKNTSIRRSARQAKSQAMKKISPNQEKSPTKGRRSMRKDKSSETPNNSLVEPQLTSTPVLPTVAVAAAPNLNDKSPLLQNQSIKSENSTTLGNSTFLKDTSLNKSDKKRIITITLVRTKDSLNFRYCDQYKRSIDFSTVSPDELEDIRKSLMIPEIWTNLREAFKNSPPDEKTIDQLKTILGDEYVL